MRETHWETKTIEMGFSKKKFVVFKYDAVIVTDPSGTMIAAAPDGAPPRRIGHYSK